MILAIGLMILSVIVSWLEVLERVKLKLKWQENYLCGLKS